MCFSARVSFLTLGIGTVFNLYNIFHFQDPTITATSILWQWVLLMQLFDGIAWLNPPTADGECNTANRFAAKGAFIANLLQPVVLALAFFALQSDKISPNNKILASSLTLIYLVWSLYVSNKIPEVTCLKQANDCDNLNYSWWNQFPGSASVYMFVLMFLILLMARPLDFAVMQLSFITLTFIVSALVYSCATASIWCLFSAFAPILITMWKLYH